LVFDGGAGNGEKVTNMKMKDAFLGLCIVILLVSEVLLFVANEKKNSALSQTRSAQYDAQQARAELEQFKAATSTQTSENARLRSERQGLFATNTMLQAEIARMASTNLLLSQELDSMHYASQQQQEQLAQMQVIEQENRDRNTCISNLRIIKAAKNVWAFEHDAGTDDVPTVDDLLPYIPGGVFPSCPSGGTYSINAVGQPPTCTYPGHALPAQ
jgi:hypothetical protein